jgi:hypothetical protein
MWAQGAGSRCTLLSSELSRPEQPRAARERRGFKTHTTVLDESTGLASRARRKGPHIKVSHNQGVKRHSPNATMQTFVASRRARLGSGPPRPMVRCRPRCAAHPLCQREQTVRASPLPGFPHASRTCAGRATAPRAARWTMQPAATTAHMSLAARDWDCKNVCSPAAAPVDGCDGDAAAGSGGGCEPPGACGSGHASSIGAQGLATPG